MHGERGGDNLHVRAIIPAMTPTRLLSNLFAEYAAPKTYDEMFGLEQSPLRHCAPLYHALAHLAPHELRRRAAMADIVFRDIGITFTLTADEEGAERTIPFDIVPRLIPADEWAELERGLFQRLRALNAFLWDVYHDQRCVRDGVVPRWIIHTGRHFLRPMIGIDPPLGVYTHVGGIDLVRDADGRFRVLEDNVRVPSGVSYMLQNRQVMMRLFPELFRGLAVRSVDHYADRLLATLRAVGARGQRDPSVVVLTPGVFNSAYFEHAFLAQQMGVPLVEPDDLLIRNARCEMRTTRGLEAVDVIYRRIDDEFLDPLTFRSDSMLGVPGLMHAVRAGNLTLANAPGSGIADDKVVYRFVPDLIRFFLGEEPLLPTVETYLPALDSDRRTVLDNLGDLVVKAANESGGYGMLVGPFAASDELEAFHEKILANPRNFIAQPVVRLSTCPTLVGDRLEPRHVDLRPYLLMGAAQTVVPGGLTRVALRPGSLVVNSSQGGGSKDTWVVDLPAEDEP
jgi:uncharacterized circularly permuted ATP-grasp superfamily protein